MSKLASFSEVARLAGVSRQAVSLQARDGSLAGARIGQRLDVESEEVRDYLIKHGVSQEEIDKFVESTLESKGPGLESEAEEFEDYAELTIREILDRFGTNEKFSDWLDANKTFEQVIHQRLKNQELSGQLIRRELVKTHVFGAIESSNRRLLSDTPKTIARRLYAAAKADEPVEEGEKVVREIISSQLRPVKDTAARVLRNA